MAWTSATRGDYVCPSGSHASDVTDREWALIGPLLPAAREGGRPRTTCLRRVVNAVFYLLQAGCQWRMLPGEFPKWRTVHSYFAKWSEPGPDGISVLERALKKSGWRGPYRPGAPSPDEFSDC